MLHLCRYIHANPVKDGLVKKPEDWPYSNNLEWINQRSGTLIDREFVRDHFQTTSEYEAFVKDYRQLPKGLSHFRGISMYQVPGTAESAWHLPLLLLVAEDSEVGDVIPLDDQKSVIFAGLADIATTAPIYCQKYR